MKIIRTGEKVMENAPKKKIDGKYIKIGIVAFSVIIASVLFYFLFFDSNTLFNFIKRIGDVLTPFAIGAVLAYLLKPLCVMYEKLVSKWFKKMKRRHKAEKYVINISVAFAVITFLALIYVMVAAVIPQVIDSVKTLINTAPELFDNFIGWLKNLVKDNKDLSAIVDRFSVRGSDLIKIGIDKLVNIDVSKWYSHLIVGVKGLVTFLTNILVGLIAGIYILARRKKFAIQGKMLIHSVFTPKWADRVMDEIKYIDKMFSGFINGKIVDSIIIGILTFIVLTIVKMPYPLLISVIIGVTNVIPYFGPFMGAIPSALIILMIDPIKGLWFIVIIIIIQQLDGNVIGPTILGESTGISSFWVLFSILLFGGLFGFVGMVIGVPLFAVIYDLVRRAIRYGLIKHKKGDMYLEYEREQEAEEQESSKKFKLFKVKKRR